MTLPTLPQLVIEALRSAGATEEMIAAAIKAGGERELPTRARSANMRAARRARKPTVIGRSVT
jgi:hypothetical protein